MIRFPPVDAALEGFRVTRERPLAVLAWAGALLVVNLLIQAWLVVSGLGLVIAAMQTAMLSGKGGAGAGMAMDRSSGGAPLVLLIAIAVNAVLYTAVLRAVLTPRDSRFAFLRLGMAELRQFALGLMLFLAVTAYLAIALAVGAGASVGSIDGFLRVLVLVGLFAGLVYAAVRLSLAPAMTFQENRLVVIGAWRLTKEQFWGLFGAYVLAAVLAVLVSLLSFIIFGAVAQSLKMATGDAFDLVAASARDRGGASLEGLLTPTMLILLAFSAFWSTLAFTIVNAVGPAAFRHLAGRSVAPAG